MKSRSRTVKPRARRYHLPHKSSFPLSQHGLRQFQQLLLASNEALLDLEVASKLLPDLRDLSSNTSENAIDMLDM